MIRKVHSHWMYPKGAKLKLHVFGYGTSDNTVGDKNKLELH